MPIWKGWAGLEATCGTCSPLASPNVQCVLSLVDTGTNCSLMIHSDSELYPGPAVYIYGYRGMTLKTKAMTAPLRDWGSCLYSPTSLCVRGPRIHPRGRRFARPALADISRGVSPEGVSGKSHGMCTHLICSPPPRSASRMEGGECQAISPTRRPCRD